MKKFTVSFLFALTIATFAFGAAFAAPGGMPAAHGVDGQTFGYLVSNLAQSDPGALAYHTSGGQAGGMPALHGVDGQTFGALVSNLAQTAPGVLAGHVSGR
jgi:hypothetical protein